ncbi:hypothetical protein B8W70_02300 [Pseudomonas sp. 1239]|uniref:hypothetical protein n=1 Tax=Pseudomonas TaxID=286 RepID=UPI0005C253CE|nr:MULTISPECIES: hypothetical protein [Pseudomonas]KIU52298.1 hypothetical protein QV12_09415 [Pseudomonas putida]OUM35515.1 hypothetical protein B8W70_02300 [Pseudomonas sp. 1239]WKL66500.1 hypothetical protein Q1Z72_24935 [Pseudomonas qingdaonensis]
MRTQIIIEDHVVPQLLTSAIEAYEVSHKAHARGRANDRLETFGLLWGYALPVREGVPARLVAVVATVETSALRHTEWVQPDFASIRMKRDFFREYWPQLELIGTFHSHPYKDLSEVNDAKGWRASEDDKEFWPAFHEEVCPDMDELAHLVIAITALGRKGSAMPDRLPGNEYTSGYVVSADMRKLWIKGYTSELNEEIDDDAPFDEAFMSGDVEMIRSYELWKDEEVLLEIPSLEARFRHELLRR